MPMPAQRSGTGSIEYRGLQRMDSTHVQNRFSGGLARTGSLPTLPNHLRPRTSGPGAPREAQEPGRPGRMLGPLGAQRLSNSGLTQQRRLSGSVEGRPTSSCGGVSRAPDTRPSYAAVLTSPALSGARGGTPSHASMNSHGRYGVPQQQPACAPPPWGARASTPGAATMPAPGTSMRAGALAPRSAAANSGLSAGAGGGGGKPPPVLMNGCVASSAADRTPQPQALGTHAAGASAEAKPAKACAAGRPSSGEEHSAPPNGSAAPSPQRGTAPVVFRVGAAAATIQGSHPGKAANQDRYLVELPTATPQAGKAHGSGMGGIAGAHGSGSGSQLAVAAVFDGHGELGHRVSAFVTDKLRAELLGTAEEACQQNGALSAPLIARKLAGSFERTNRALSASGIDVRHSGTTACTAQLAGSELIVANVGDSRAVIGRYEPGAANALIARDLSIDHKPDSDREHRRITRAGGRVAPMHVPGARHCAAPPRSCVAAFARACQLLATLPQGEVGARALAAKATHQVLPVCQAACAKLRGRVVLVAQQLAWQRSSRRCARAACIMNAAPRAQPALPAP